MQRRNWILLAIAVAIGLFAVLIANAWFSGMEQKQAQTGQQQQLARIVVATQPLDFGTRLTAQNVRLQDWPATSVPEGAFRSIPDILKNDRVALRPTVPGEALLASNLSGNIGRATLASLLPPGMRAVSIAINDVRGVAGFVLPGTMVDVLLTRRIAGEGASNQDLRSDVILQNVHVLAVDQLANEKKGDPKISRTATLAVSLNDAQRLSIAEKVGTLSLALRKVEDSAGLAAGGEARSGLTVTNRQLGGPNLVIPARATSVARQAYGSAQAGVTPPSLPAIGSAAYAPAHSGPSMTVFRGVQPTEYPVSRIGSR